MASARARRKGAAELLGPAPLVVVSERPFNAESPYSQQLGLLTPVDRFYVRSHFGLNQAPGAEDWRLEVSGAVQQPLSLSLADLLGLPARSLIATLECAGNGRRYLEPPVPGEQWALGAVSTAEWAGVSLSEVLARAGIAAGALEVLFAGVDRGPSPVDGATIRFERSLPLEQALHPDVLLAYAMNGAPLTADHGAPLRLVVPGWYGMASVKWLCSIEVLRAPFRGVFQADRYVYDFGDGRPVEPVTSMRVRALIAQPTPGARIPASGAQVRGWVWSGAAPIAGVEVSDDGGETWVQAELGARVSPYAWCAW